MQTTNIDAFKTNRVVLIIALLLGFLTTACDSGDAAVEPDPEVGSISFGFLRYPTVPRGSTTQLTAIAKTLDGSVIQNPILQWESSDTAVVTIDEQGSMRAVASGSATLIVRSGGKEAQKAIGVLDMEGLWMGVYDSSSGPDTIRYTLRQSGKIITGSFKSIYGFPPLTANNTGSITGEFESTEFTHTVRVPAAPCNLQFTATMKYQDSATSAALLIPTGTAPLTSDNCSSLNGTISLTRLVWQSR